MRDKAQQLLTMQDALMTLTQYWANHGCLIVQPMNTEVGAGTGNPATALRVLGPEPWNVAYVEPSVRPDDARYGDNPNRLQTHTQFQVILKPDPGNPQELYLGSLAALGIDITTNDVRFVEDNWASPALGAWGLGWEVWLNGLEITQFTYFQQAGGVTLDPVSVEITYGMERIMMALQGVSHFKDITYAPGISYGEAFGQPEYEMSRYYLDDADIDTNHRLFDAYAAEAQRMIADRLPIPAHTFVLKCSHTFNVLDSRGAISTTERARAFATMRNLTRKVAQLWIDRRAELEHPLGLAALPADAQPSSDGEAPNTTAPLLLEIGVEEMPPHEVDNATELTRTLLVDNLATTQLSHGEIKVFATPRRIVALVSDVAPVEADTERTAKGPRRSAAFDADGNPTKAALGFARGQGVDVAELETITVDGVEHIGRIIDVPGRAALEVLSTVLSQVVAGLRSDKNMRWNAPGLQFTRPIRWVVALLDTAVVPVAVANLAAGRHTHVHRWANEPVIAVPHARDYSAWLASHDIEISGAARRQRIIDSATALAAEVGGVIDFDGEARLLDEVTNLVEDPQPLRGEFSADYLQLPTDILTTVMRKHQRYFPARNAAGDLLPYFVTVANGRHDIDTVRTGNEAVLRARYEDAAFFFRADSQRKPAEFVPQLAKLTFADQLGSMADRARRIETIALRFAEYVHVDAATLDVTRRAGELAKFDLATQMVVELSSLAGVMAREYAARAGEADAVAQALYEMELPRNASDAVPTSVAGALLALADRFDLLAGLFATGAVPTGSSDPFGLRRAALGAVTILRSQPQLAQLTISAALRIAAEAQPVALSDASYTDALRFVGRRFEQALLDADTAHNRVAALSPLFDQPATLDTTAAQLDTLAGTANFDALAAALQRVRRIVPDGTEPDFDVAVLVEAAEKRLATTVGDVRSALGTDYDLARFAEVAGDLIQPIDDFFDDVLVMADDPELRHARLGLLATIAALASPVLDWAAL